MKTREYILISAYATLYKGLTIGTRYSLLRKQFTDENGEEMPIFEYQLQKEKIMILLAKAYAMSSSSRIIRHLITENEKKALKGDFSLLQSCHISLCGYKALFSEWSNDGISTLIKACGGHGYSSFAGLEFLFKRYYPDTIYEGENSILLLQVARSLLKAAQRVQSEDVDKIQQDMKYLAEESILDVQISTEIDNIVGLNNCRDLLRAFKKATIFHVRETAQKMYSHIVNGVNPLAVKYLIFNPIKGME